MFVRRIEIFTGFVAFDEHKNNLKRTVKGVGTNHRVFKNTGTYYIPSFVITSMNFTKIERLVERIFTNRKREKIKKGK